MNRPKNRVKKSVIISGIEEVYKKKPEEIPSFMSGDTVRLEIKVREGDKERLQAFEGIVISRKNTGLRENFTVRKISYGVGVERKFMLHSPNIASITVLRRGNVARAKLYYLRDRVGKKTRVKDKIFAKDKD